MNAGPQAGSERWGLTRGHMGVVSEAKGFGKGHSFWMVKVRCESERTWLGGRSCEMQAEPCREASLPRLLLLLLAVLPVSPALPKQLHAVLSSG